MRPGDASDYFKCNHLKPFETRAESYSKLNAWWLCELSRIIYRKEGLEEKGVPSIDRNRILGRVGLKEIRFFYTARVQAALVTARETVDEPFGVLVFRGTRGRIDNWLCNFKVFPSPWPMGGEVHTGFKRLFLEIWPRIEKSIAKMQTPLYYTGHSLGGALATLAAAIKPPRAVYTFGSPRVGDGRFQQLFRDTPVYRIATPHDIVTHLPPSRAPFGYVHVGQARDLDFYQSKPAALANTRPTSVEEAASMQPWNSYTRFWQNPPAFLADHSPVNYTAGLNV